MTGPHETRNPDPPTPPRPTWRGVAYASAYGVIAATLGLLIGQGSLVWALIVMIAIGIIVRLCTCLLIRRRAGEHPPWWKWL
jgi:hypothetical protein